MLQKFHILLIITFLGCLTVPVKSYACGAKSKKAEKSCCLKDSSEKSNKDNCCGKHKMTGQNEGNSCGGNCDNSTCSCPSPFSTLVIPDFLVKFNISILYLYIIKWTFNVLAIFLAQMGCRFLWFCCWCAAAVPQCVSICYRFLIHLSFKYNPPQFKDNSNRKKIVYR